MDFGKILTAMVTPMKDNSDVDFEEAGRLAKYLAEHGSDGIVVAGTTGESPTLSTDEKLELFRVVKEAVGKDVIVIAGIGSNSTANSVALAQKAAKTGVDGLMAVVPYYNKPSQEGLYQHFRVIAEASELPLMLYNIPGRTSINLLPETVLRLSKVPNIVALKEAVGMMDQVSELKRILPEDFMVYSGDDSLTLPMLALGCSGIISVASHVVGDEMKKMVDAWFEGDTKKALQWHLKLMPIFKGIFITANPVPVKYLVNTLGIKAGKVRLPLVDANPEEKEFLTNLLKRVKEG
ncbi:4-hydroxy-tetrahydrodipicolinate synthase [Desulfitobacterium sp.]|uniref:4-hydroxy-tetrahydrodipicolinate synthase n=1 Tax=Desulfitobacterium sp. TaxID=49981 RepID=UPI002B20E3C5|nr:4-hydroxy-tetrahydrodipicolinate synthase [Desulfitobacterium sp.]MEA4901518.1 4-hydroxy-tetrahydrodipicolinate synthase [Desulfitobacterium sp.]